jgi:hypothetical protein
MAVLVALAHCVHLLPPLPTRQTQQWAWSSSKAGCLQIGTATRPKTCFWFLHLFEHERYFSLSLELLFMWFWLLMVVKR